MKTFLKLKFFHILFNSSQNSIARLYFRVVKAFNCPLRFLSVIYNRFLTKRFAQISSLPKVFNEQTVKSLPTKLHPKRLCLNFIRPNFSS